MGASQSRESAHTEPRRRHHDASHRREHAHKHDDSRVNRADSHSPHATRAHIDSTVAGTANAAAAAASAAAEGERVMSTTSDNRSVKGVTAAAEASRSPLYTQTRPGDQGSSSTPVTPKLDGAHEEVQGAASDRHLPRVTRQKDDGTPHGESADAKRDKAHVLLPEPAAVPVDDLLSTVGGMAAQEAGTRRAAPSDRWVRLNGKEVRASWAVDAADLLEGAGPSVFGVRGFVTGTGEPAVFARARDEDAATSVLSGMRPGPQYVLVPQDAIAPAGVPLPSTVPFVAVWLKSKRPIDGGHKGVSDACGPRAASSVAFEPLPRFQQRIVEHWVRSPALGKSRDAVLAVPLDEIAAADAPSSFAAAAVAGAALRVLSASSGCYVWSEGGRNFLVVRVDPAYATMLLTEQVKREIWHAIGLDSPAAT